MCPTKPPKMPKAAPRARPVPVLEQEAPDRASDIKSDDKKRSAGTKRFRAGSPGLSLPTIGGSQ